MRGTVDKSPIGLSIARSSPVTTHRPLAWPIFAVRSTSWRFWISWMNHLLWLGSHPNDWSSTNRIARISPKVARDNRNHHGAVMRVKQPLSSNRFTLLIDLTGKDWWFLHCQVVEHQKTKNLWHRYIIDWTKQVINFSDERANSVLNNCGPSAQQKSIREFTLKLAL